MNLFVSAFDDAFLYRYDADTRKPGKERIDVRYIMGPKHRVLYDLNDKSKTLTLPVVTLQQKNLRRDSERVLNKGKIFNRLNLDGKSISKIPSPVPVSMDIEMSIITKFKEDLDQIVQNFVTQCNPYIIVSWKVPPEFGMDFIDEIRTEIQWDGDVSYESPDSINHDEKWRIMGNTTFTIKGWLFPGYENPQGPIYYIDNIFNVSNLVDELYLYDNYNLLSATVGETETITVSATPTITNFFYVYGNMQLPITDTITIDGDLDNRFLFYGNMYDRNNTFYLSGADVEYTNFELVSTAKSPYISAYRISEDNIYVKNDEMVYITLSANTLSGNGNFKFIIANDAGWIDSTLLNI